MNENATFRKPTIDELTKWIPAADQERLKLINQINNMIGDGIAPPQKLKERLEQMEGYLRQWNDLKASYENSHH